MVRRRGKRIRRDVYSSNIQKYSVYPRPAGGRGGSRGTPNTSQLQPGDKISLRIISVDEEGRGVGIYRGVKVIVEGAEPGVQVSVVIRKVEGDTAYAELAY
jgi:predicted RNA-binding protein with TRAM domain